MTGYRPWMDGVRGVGIVMVLVQHTFGSAMPFDIGYYGLAMFFALSGYLITSLLLDERIASGAVSLRAFYLRRAGRLVPALVLCAVVMDLLFVLAGDLRPLPGSLAALTYTANYVEILDADGVGGFGPTWSLAVEEHFYLLWPLALLWMLRRRRLRGALWTTLAICVGATVWRGVLAVLGAPESLIATGSLERADALLYGCAAAIAVRLGWRPAGWLVWAGIVTIAVTNLAFRGHPILAAVFANGTVAVAAAAFVVCLDYRSMPVVHRVLSLRLVVALGVVSYGVYLWHGPLMRLVHQIGAPGPAWRAVAACVAIAIAVASYHVVERPLRKRARRRADRLVRGRGGAGLPVEEAQERFVLEPAGPPGHPPLAGQPVPDASK